MFSVQYRLVDYVVSAICQLCREDKDRCLPGTAPTIRVRPLTSRRIRVERIARADAPPMLFRERVVAQCRQAAVVIAELARRYGARTDAPRAAMVT
jgi:hypothetical protein